MRINFTFRHMDSSEAVKSHATAKLKKLERFEDRQMSIESVFWVEKKFQKHVEFKVNGTHGTFLQTETREDMREAIDIAVDKLDRQLARAKDKAKHHKGHQSTTPRVLDM
ncbi:MAG: putative sigma-54 modulation protein [Myxococcota bacterium]|jgi:putative sigma-54 modulation protein